MATKSKRGKSKARAVAKARRAQGRIAKLNRMAYARNTQKWADLISTAAMTSAVRERFLASPEIVVEEFGIKLEKKDDDRIPQMQEALRRFGNYPKLDQQDVDNWTVGLMHHTQSTRCVPTPKPKS